MASCVAAVVEITAVVVAAAVQAAVAIMETMALSGLAAVVETTASVNHFSRGDACENMCDALRVAGCNAHDGSPIRLLQIFSQTLLFYSYNFLCF